MSMKMQADIDRLTAKVEALTADNAAMRAELASMREPVKKQLAQIVRDSFTEALQESLAEIFAERAPKGSRRG